MPHPIRRAEVFSGKCDDLTIARMIDGLDSHHFRFQFLIMLSDESGEFGFRAAGADDQDFAEILYGIDNLMSERSFQAAFSRAGNAGLVMEMNMGLTRMKGCFLGILRIEGENARFRMIDPNNGVIMSHLFFSSQVLFEKGYDPKRKRSLTHINRATIADRD